ISPRRRLIPGDILHRTLLADELVDGQAPHHVRPEGDLLAKFRVVTGGIDRGLPGRDAVVNKVGEVRYRIVRAGRNDFSGRDHAITHKTAMDLQNAWQLDTESGVALRGAAGRILSGHRDPAPI